MARAAIVLAFAFVCAAAASASAAAAPNTLFAFVGDTSSTWQHWNWTKITHVGIFADADPGLAQHCHNLGIPIIQSPSLPARTQWANATVRAAWVKATVAHVVARNYSGLTFDYEGDLLSSSERSGYTALAEETMAALREALGDAAYLSICVGGRPTYEFRNYDYIALAATTTQFFVMSYDLEFWDDYTCFLYNKCSLAEAPLRDINLGLQEYMDLGIPASHLVMGLPWYGITYKYIAGVPFNQGTVQYGDVPHLLKNHTEWKPRLIENDLTWRVDCGGPCTEGNDGTEMWYDTPETYTAKYSLARKYGLGGVGMWQADSLDYNDTASAQAIWTAINSCLDN